MAKQTIKEYVDSLPKEKRLFPDISDPDEYRLHYVIEWICAMIK